MDWNSLRQLLRKATRSQSSCTLDDGLRAELKESVDRRPTEQGD